MTPWLVDASALLAAEDGDDDNHDAAVELLEPAHPLLTLDLAFYEVSNVAVRAWHDQEDAGRLRDMVAAAESWSARLVSCDIRDLISGDLAVLPADIRTATRTDRP